MELNNIVVPVAIASASITFIVTISLVLIVTTIIVTRKKSGEHVCMYVYMFVVNVTTCMYVCVSFSFYVWVAYY